MWTSIATFTRTNHAVTGLWLQAHELLPTTQIIRLEASGSWSCFGPGIPACGPRGHLHLNISSDQLIQPKSPPGALIGKLGGSDSAQEDGTVFAIGEFCVIGPLEKRVPLFVSVNGAWRTGALTFASLGLSISVTAP
jgi:hypothetical protein